MSGTLTSIPLRVRALIVDLGVECAYLEFRAMSSITIRKNCTVEASCALASTDRW